MRYSRQSVLLLPLLCVLLLPLPVGSAEPSTILVPAFGESEAAKAQSIVIVGPAALAVGQDGTYRLTGTPPVDISKPLLDQLGWALGEDRMYVYGLAPKAAHAPLDVRLELVIAASGVTLQPVIHYTPAIAGEHRLLVDWNHGQDQLAEILIQVGPKPDPDPDPDPGPDPDPDPEPDPIPPPPGERFILVVAETGTRTAQQFQAISGLTSYLKTTKHQWRTVDPDAVDYSTGKTPEWLRGYLEAIAEAKVPLPVLAVCAPSKASPPNSGDGDVNVILAIVPLPKTAAEAIETVKKWGG